MIPSVDLKRQYDSIKKEINASIAEVLDSGRYILGENVSLFEKEYAAYCQRKYCIGVANGLDALKISLICSNIHPGDEVITTPLTAVATSLAISEIGAVPVFADIDPGTFNITAESIAKKLSKKTKAILPVHIYGNPADMEPIAELAERKKLALVEDACQAHGAEYKSRKLPYAGIGCYSFYPTKNLGAYGDGGAVVTDDWAVAEKAAMLRNYGQRKRYEHMLRGMNSRLDELHAATLRVKLKHLDEWVDKRRQLAKQYSSLLQNVKLPAETNNSKHSYHLYVIRTNKRDELKEFLEKKQILTDIHYPILVPMQPCYCELGYSTKDIPNAVKATAEILSLPMFPELRKEEIESVAAAIKEFFR